MKLPLTLLTLLTLATLPSYADGGDPAELAVIQRDRDLNAAISRGDATAAAAFYDGAFVLTTGAGTRKSKAEIVKEIGRTDLVFEVNETSEVRVIRRGDTAVLVGVLRQRGRLGEKAFDATMLVTDTWVRSGDTWLLLAGHASARPRPAS